MHFHHTSSAIKLLTKEAESGFMATQKSEAGRTQVQEFNPPIYIRMSVRGRKIRITQHGKVTLKLYQITTNRKT